MLDLGPYGEIRSSTNPLTGKLTEEDIGKKITGLVPQKNGRREYYNYFL
jgi:hypothetical protein